MHNIKNIVIIIISLIFYFLHPLYTYAENKLSITAESAIAIDNNTGKILYEYNSDKKMPMASTTKIMTAILAIENCDLNEYVHVGINPTHVGGSSLGLDPGEKIKMLDLLYGLMLESGNDAAIAIAEHISGSTNNFVEIMNKKALEIGAYNTHFANPHGLDIGINDHFTTAYDLAQITRYALKNPIFTEIISTKYKTISWETHSWNRYLKNHNKMLWLYDGVYGVKTGYTKKAGRCLVTACNKDGLNITVVTLNCPDDWNDTTKILDYVYKNYILKSIFTKGAIIKSIYINNGLPKKLDLITEQDIILPLKRDEKLSFTVLTLDYVNAPIKKGDILGILYIQGSDFKVALVAKQTINEENLVEKIRNMLYNFKI